MSSDLLTIPHGTAEWRPGGSAPAITVDRGAHDPLRLNDGPYEFFDMSQSAGTGAVAERLALLRDHILDFCDMWAKRPRQFLALYFRFIEDVIRHDRAAIDEALRRFGGLFKAEDYAFSALRPLPRAHLAVAGGKTVRVDFAFWTGERLVAVDIPGDDARGTAWETRRNSLREAGILAVEVPAAILLKDDPAALYELLPPDFTAFWRSEKMPSSPFRGGSLGDVVAGVPDF